MKATNNVEKQDYLKYEVTIITSSNQSIQQTKKT